ncbi:hypothetical protein [Streptomyces sp. TLI_185]|uniref:hypothetical protein n=1 Tax=Streptomyces sp. TLI_185 TaxID=2485151 RepID=UPI000FBF06B1|nr:hypothetical protein [Streptomyces sp. TLI_185]RPF35418.1 hypothetical protein EDD92_5428 [Streptomyces sp. TLI_185]
MVQVEGALAARGCVLGCVLGLRLETDRFTVVETDRFSRCVAAVMVLVGDLVGLYAQLAK